jgi:hypothetical protein
MPVKLTNITGNGSIVPNSIFSYNYSEEVTSLEPSTISGATSQVNVSAIAVNSEATVPHSDSKLLINNQMSLTDSDYGTVSFQVKGVSKNLEIVSIAGDTVQSRLNVEVLAEPQGGPEANLLTAIVYYCELAGVTPIIQEPFASEIEIVPVNFIGWRGILWDKLKQLCAGFSANTEDNVGLEMVIINDELIFRKARQLDVALDRNLVGDSISIESFESAKSVTVVTYDTRYEENEVFYDLSNFETGGSALDKFQSSIADSMQVNPGETLRKRFTVNATFNSVNQPECVEQIDRVFPDPYEGGTGRNGEYVIVGTDDLPIKPEQWTGNGGSLTVELTDESGEPLPPGEIDLVIKAPRIGSLPKAADPADIAFAPYKIGVESSGGTDYPALWLTGTGVFYEKKQRLLLTGSADEYTSEQEGATVDNIFINDNNNASSRGVAAAQANCGPRISVNRQVAQGLQFGDIGSMFIAGLNKYRIESLSFNDSSISLVATPSFIIEEWNEIWDGKTFEDFETIILDPELFPEETLRFNEFTIIPRIGA